MKFKSASFPTVSEIQQAVREHIETECGGVWPDELQEECWLEVGPAWSAKIFTEDGSKRITVFYDFKNRSGNRETDTSCGICIPAS